MDENNKNNNINFNAEAEFSALEIEIRTLVLTKKYWALKYLNEKEQVSFINKLIKLDKDGSKQQLTDIFGNQAEKNERRYWLNSIFTSGCLELQALIALNDYLNPIKFEGNDLHSHLKFIWESYDIDLFLRDIVGKRDRFRVMITPQFISMIVGRHMKFAEFLKEKKLLNDEQFAQQIYIHVIKTAEDEYSKVKWEFWRSFLLYGVFQSFLISMVGVLIAALIGLTAFSSLSGFAVLLATTVTAFKFKFIYDFESFPWDWQCWWKKAKNDCLEELRSQKIKNLFLPIEDKSKIEINKLDLNANDESLEEKDDQSPNNGNLNQCMDLNINDKRKNKKWWSKLYYRSSISCLVIFITSALIRFFPSLIAEVVSLVLGVFKLQLAFTFAPVVVSAALYVAIVALVLAIAFYVTSKVYYKKSQQCRFDIYQQRGFGPKNFIVNENQVTKYFMKLPDKRGHDWYTKKELEESGIKVNDIPDKKKKDDMNAHSIN
ncbi:MAG: hypothetical protein IJU86_03565 [Firmicutes bacterium]|nr:hypothetical protein [Bacillota bacterium]